MMQDFIQRCRPAASRALTIFAVLSLCVPYALLAQRQRRVAVMPFDVGAAAKRNTQQAGVQADIGRDLADLLVQRLVTDGKFQVIERAALDKIIKEQNLSNSDRMDSSSAAKIGRIAGVDAIIIGSVTEFGVDETDTSTGSVMRSIPHMGGIGMKEHTSTATVATTARLVDTNTAAILASATGAGNATKSQKKLVSGNSNNALGYDSKSREFGNTLIGEATMKAIVATAVQLETAPAVVADVPPPPPTPYSGVVADVNGNIIILNVGSKAGVKVGDTVIISKAEGRIIKNPTTGATLKVIRERLGEAKVTDVDAGTATATYSGNPVKVKDIAASAP